MWCSSVVEEGNEDIIIAAIELMMDHCGKKDVFGTEYLSIYLGVTRVRSTSSYVEIDTES